MKIKKLYNRKEVLHDVANLAYVVGDVREGRYTSHSLHHTYDICAEGNIDRVNRVFDLAASEVESLLCRSAGAHVRRYGPDREEKLLRNLIHEYLVTRVFVDWLTVAFPPGISMTSDAGTSKSATDNVIQVWKEKTAEARKALADAVRSRSGYVLTRRVSPL